MNKSDLERIQQFLEAAKPLQLAEERAESLLSRNLGSKLFIGMAGCQLESDSVEIKPGLLSIKRVTNPPGVVHVCRAANLQETDYLGVSRHSGRLVAEIVVGSPETDVDLGDVDSLYNLAWHVAALLKLQGIDSLCCPAASSVSWDTVAAVKDNSANFRLLDDIPRMIIVEGAGAQLSAQHCIWAATYFETALRLREFNHSRRFGLAFNIAYTWNHTGDPRIALVSIWSALEALFGDKRDAGVTETLAARLASWVPSTSPDEVRALYKRRCDAVHGRWIEFNDLRQPLLDSLHLLRGSLKRCIEEEKVPLPDWKP